jgi:hypothetical protein
MGKSLVEHDLFGKSGTAFPDHAQGVPILDL